MSFLSPPQPVRPAFNSARTSDRLREGSGLLVRAVAASSSNLRKPRKSVFKELGLDDNERNDDDADARLSASSPFCSSVATELITSASPLIPSTPQPGQSTLTAARTNSDSSIASGASVASSSFPTPTADAGSDAIGSDAMSS